MCKNQPTYVNAQVNRLVTKEITTKRVWVSLTLLRGRSSCRTRTDSLRRATKRAFWVGVAEARRERRRELWKEHWVRNAEEIGMERTNDEAIQIPNRNEMVDRKKKRMWSHSHQHTALHSTTHAHVSESRDNISSLVPRFPIPVPNKKYRNFFSLEITITIFNVTVILFLGIFK